MGPYLPTKKALTSAATLQKIIKMLPIVCWYRRPEGRRRGLHPVKRIYWCSSHVKEVGTRKTIKKKEEKYLIKGCRWERQQRTECDKRKRDRGGNQRAPEQKCSGRIKEIIRGWGSSEKYDPPHLPLATKLKGCLNMKVTQKESESCKLFLSGLRRQSSPKGCARYGISAGYCIPG